ncbi:MAG: hypothetical protein U0165_20425 [Polyangiaceae bacterium]
MGPRRFSLSTLSVSVVCVACIESVGCHPSADSQTSAPPPCVVDGTYQASATRSSSTGSVCDVDDARSISSEITMRRTGPVAVWIERKGKYGHTANLDPNTVHDLG